MKSIYVFCLYISLLFIASCSKDQGNYDYTEVNKLVVVDTAGEPINRQEFEVAEGEDLSIEVQAKGTLPDFDPAKVKYVWAVDKDTLGVGSKVTLKASQFKPGSNNVKLYATDPTTNLEYLNVFSVFVSKTVSKGFFVLTKDADLNSILYIKSSRRSNSTWFRLTSLGKENPYPLGKNPVAIDLKSRYRVYDGFTVVTKDGVNPILTVDLPSMEPYAIVKGTGTSVSGGDLHPTFFRMGYSAINGTGFILDNGRVRRVSEGYLWPEAIRGVAKYDFGKNGICYDDFNVSGNAGRFLMGYDKISKRILFFESGRQRFNFDQISENLSTEPLGDMEVVGAGPDAFGTTGGLIYGLILRKGDVVYNYSTSGNFNAARKFEFTKVKENAKASIPGIEKAVSFNYDKWARMYYYAIGRTLYRFPFFSVSPLPFFTLPEDGTGNIVAWSFDRDESGGHKHVGIATFNPGAKEDKKGSFYHYSIKSDGSGNPLTLVSKSLYQIDEAVSIALGVE